LNKLIEKRYFQIQSLNIKLLLCNLLKVMMKAIGYTKSLTIDEQDSLIEIEIVSPQVGDHDLLVRVNAVSVNPVDTKMRVRSTPEPGQTKILGWDAVGIVEKTGLKVTRFKTGDRVFYAGSIARPGANAELHSVDERIVGRAPVTLGDADAAALPLTTITAWELLFDRLKIARGGGRGQNLLIIGGAGGVGSILIQLARRLTELTVIATASRDETRQWCLEMGAHIVIDHSNSLTKELSAQGIGLINTVVSLTQTHRYIDQIVECLKPQGAIALIDDPEPFDITKLKRKSLSLHWESMFTRSLFNTDDIAKQGTLLDEVAALLDKGILRTTAKTHLGAISATNLKKAHTLIESGTAIGKIVLAGF
jgi:zinc-binding alcohol dehydrogenase family protein